MDANEILQNFSATELLQLAEKKRQQELLQSTQPIRDALQHKEQEYTELIARHTEERKAIEREIDSLRKQLGKKNIPRRKVKRGKDSLSEAILHYLQQHGATNLAVLRTELSNEGLVTNNLNQQLSYLKRCNRITSPSRGVWEVALVRDMQ